MADNNQSTLDNLREELASLKSQMQDIFKTVSAKGQDASSDLAARIAHELHNYKHIADRKAGQLRDAGQAGLEDVENHVRQNPVASLLIAFGAGYVISCLFRRLR